MACLSSFGQCSLRIKGDHLFPRSSFPSQPAINMEQQEVISESKKIESYIS